jgi:hypothetical protein
VQNGFSNTALGDQVHFGISILGADDPDLEKCALSTPIAFYFEWGLAECLTLRLVAPLRRESLELCRESFHFVFKQWARGHTQKLLALASQQSPRAGGPGPGSRQKAC